MLEALCAILPPMEIPRWEPVEIFEAIVRWLVEIEQRQLVLVIDEFDYLLEGAAPTELDVLRQLLGVCRGYAQTTERLALILVGRDPELLVQPRLGSALNPMLGWLRQMYVGPMPRAELDELLRTLGPKVGLDLGPETTDAAWRWTGGHPMLSRRFGSTALRIAKAAETFRTDDCIDRIEDEYPEDPGAREIAAEVEALLRERYPGAFRQLRAAVLGEEAPDDPVLRRFGLVGSGAEIAELWRLWFQAVPPIAAAS